MIYGQITAEVVQKSSKELKGSGGPTLVDADSWKHFLCSRAYDNHPYHLAEAISGLAKRLCTDQIHPDCLHGFIAGRLIPLDKGADSQGNPGIRHIGIGEVLRRIVGKSVMYVFRADIQLAGGCLQTCTGVRAGIEASIHAMNAAWHNQFTEGLLQVDADNTFNRLNRRIALHNIKQICPSIHMYLLNHYQRPAHLTVSDGSTQQTLLSEEGCTQGDPAAMIFLCHGCKPLVDQLHGFTNKDLCMQSWYADDSSAIGKLKEIKIWWQKLSTLGPKYGYYPKACKTKLVLKDSSLMNYAKSLFADTEINITIHGQKHLGAVIGTDDSRQKYVAEKVSKWVDDITELSNIARKEPQAALSAFTKSICHRWTFIQHTVPNTKDLFIPLENCLRNVFIPSIIGRPISNVERSIISLPVRFGGLGIANPSENCEREYEASQIVTQFLEPVVPEIAL